MIATIKTQIYDIIKNQLEYNICDNPYGEEVNHFPYLLLTLQECRRECFRDIYSYTIRIKIDMFSNYNGEKEILDMEKNIFEAMQQLWENDFLTYFEEKSFRIIDDKSTSIVRKHGIVNYEFYCIGGTEDDS